MHTDRTTLPTRRLGDLKVSALGMGVMNVELDVFGTSSGASQLANIDLGAKAGTTSDGTHGLSPLPGV